MTNHTQAHVISLDWAIVESGENDAFRTVEVDVEGWLFDLDLHGTVLTTVRLFGPSGHPLVTFVGSEAAIRRIELAYDEMADPA